MNDNKGNSKFTGKTFHRTLVKPNNNINNIDINEKRLSNLPILSEKYGNFKTWQDASNFQTALINAKQVDSENENEYEM